MKLTKYISENVKRYLIEQESLNDKFWKWFNGSKVVDNSGNPLVVYHGTDTEFNSFDNNKKRKGWLSTGFYFTENELEARDFGRIIIPVYLRLINPFIIKGDTINKDGSISFEKSAKEQMVDKYPELNNIDWKYFSDYLQKKGHDGVINSFNLITVFTPTQIKSIYNDGTWDTNDDNIYS